MVWKHVGVDRIYIPRQYVWDCGVCCYPVFVIIALLALCHLHDDKDTDRARHGSLHMYYNMYTCAFVYKTSLPTARNK